MKLFNAYNLGDLTLQNRVVMAPMTRCRAIGNIPNDIMAEHYNQRGSAGLLITEGVSPSPNGLGYARIPGIFNEEQVEGWKKVTKAAHEKGAKIFIQLMHTGRVSNIENLPEGAKIVGPSAVQLSGEMYTDTKGMQAYSIPQEMTLEDIATAQQEYVQASLNAIEAGFDGVELHGANGYLIDQFINPASNLREDQYGGSIANRARFGVEVAQKVADAIGKEKTAIRLSPYGVFNDMIIFDDEDATYEYIAKKLSDIGIVYLHTVDHSSQGAPEVPLSIKKKIKENFNGTLITSGGFDKEKAEKAIEDNIGDIVAFGRPFISNPDLVERMKNDLPLTPPDFSTFYTPGEKGYTDYSVA